MLIKFCGITDSAALASAKACGADMCGFIFHPGSPRNVEPEFARNLASRGLRRVGVFVNQNASEIARIMDIANLHMAQLHGKQDTDCAAAIGPERVIRVLWPASFSGLEELCGEAEKWAEYCACFLLDAGMSGGGSGKSLAWHSLRDLQLPRPWFLAGALSPENIAEALAACSPDGVDFNSGVECSPGKKSPAKMFMASRKVRESEQQKLNDK